MSTRRKPSYHGFAIDGIRRPPLTDYDDNRCNPKDDHEYRTPYKATSVAIKAAPCWSCI